MHAHVYVCVGRCGVGSRTGGLEVVGLVGLVVCFDEGALCMSLNMFPQSTKLFPKLHWETIDIEAPFSYLCVSLGLEAVCGSGSGRVRGCD